MHLQTYTVAGARFGIPADAGHASAVPGWIRAGRAALSGGAEPRLRPALVPGTPYSARAAPHRLDMPVLHRLQRHSASQIKSVSIRPRKRLPLSHLPRLLVQTALVPDTIPHPITPTCSPSHDAALAFLLPVDAAPRDALPLSRTPVLPGPLQVLQPLPRLGEVLCCAWLSDTLRHSRRLRPAPAWTWTYPQLSSTTAWRPPGSPARRCPPR